MESAPVELPPHFALVVFDFDGTLADSRQTIVSCMAESLATIGAPPPDPARLAEWIGLPLSAMVDFLLGPDTARASREAVVTAFMLRYAEASDRHTCLFEGMREVLQAAHDGGMMLAIATSKGRAGLAHAIEALGIAHLFHTTRTVDQVRHPKPHPEMLEAILHELGVDPAGAIMVGDTTYDIEMGRAAGVKTCGVTYGAHGAQRLAEVEADYLIDAPRDIAAVLGVRLSA